MSAARALNALVRFCEAQRSVRRACGALIDSAPCVCARARLCVKYSVGTTGDLMFVVCVCVVAAAAV